MKQRHPEALKLFACLEEITDRNAAAELAFYVDLPLEANAEQRAAWVCFITSELERRFDAETVKSLRAQCHCQESGVLEQQKDWLKGIYDQSANLEDFVRRMNSLGAGWYLDGQDLYTRYTECSCPMLEAVEALPTLTWCQCTIGFGKELFRHVFGYEVDIEVLKTIKSGHPFCLVKVSRQPQ